VKRRKLAIASSFRFFGKFVVLMISAIAGTCLQRLSTAFVTGLSASTGHAPIHLQAQSLKTVIFS
jgi:hypothetical protein